MAEWNTIRLLLFVSLMIFAALVSSKPLLHLTLRDTTRCYEYETVIQMFEPNNRRIYMGRVPKMNYTAARNTTKVILYISSSTYHREIMTAKNQEQRIEIQKQLEAKSWQLLYLEVKNYVPNDECAIAEFIRDTILAHPSQQNFTINTIGEDRLDKMYVTTLEPKTNFPQYREDTAVCGGQLKAELGSISSSQKKNNSN